ncbi:LCP family protein [Nocardioidaceae bacterium]|nr:LCP family protein [Nocardioidaceae bacterium]
MHLPDQAPEQSRHRAASLRFRRALTLMAMTLVLPGSAQLVAGNRRVGRIAVRTAATIAATAVLVLLLGALSSGAAITLLTQGWILGLVRLGLMGLAVGWVLLFLDAWRLGQPLGLAQRQRLAVTGVNGLLCFTTAGALLFGANVAGVAQGLVSDDGVLSSGEASEPWEGRYNVLLLGGDSGADRWGLRPDSIMVASIDEETGQTVLFGLPRNMADFTFPEGSVMAREFPQGFDCEGCYLNSLATWARDNHEIFGSKKSAGIEATLEAVEGITGLPINYWAMVNLRGFRNLVDAVGGVRLNVTQPIPVGGVGAPIDYYIEPGEDKLLDGFETLWFARSRATSDDYSRMARQKCVLNAMVEQLDPMTVVTSFGDIAEASKAMVKTSVPASELSTFVPLAMKARSQPIRTVSFVPPLIDTGNPDIALIHERVRRALGDSPRPEKKAAVPTTPLDPSADENSTGGSLGTFADGYAANDSDDLDSVC